MNLIGKIFGAFIFISILLIVVAGLFTGIEYMNIAHHGNAIWLSIVIESIILGILFQMVDDK